MFKILTKLTFHRMLTSRRRSGKETFSGAMLANNLNISNVACGTGTLGNENITVRYRYGTSNTYPVDRYRYHLIKVKHCIKRHGYRTFRPILLVRQSLEQT